MMAVSLSFALSCDIYVESEWNQEQNLHFHLTQMQKGLSIDGSNTKKKFSNSKIGKNGNMFLVAVVHGITFRNGTLDK